MELMRRIYTRTGDQGMTGIHGGGRVRKTDIRIEANGCIDELNVAIGIVRSFMPVDHPWQNDLKEIQLTLMTVMSLVATPSSKRELNPNHLPENLVTNIEHRIDEVTAQSSESEYFILPGGSIVSAFLHQCRVAARRAERRLWQLNAEDTVPENILAYINRLSDLFFALARHEMQASGLDEERWKAFAYKRMKK